MVYLLANCSGVNQLAFQSRTDADKSYVTSKLIQREKVQFKYLGLDPKPSKAHGLASIVNSLKVCISFRGLYLLYLI